MIERTQEQIYRELGEVMTNTFPDRDISVSVSSGTRVFGDLGLASIDLIVLGERLELFYGRRLPFGPFLTELRNRGAEDLELGELVAFLHRNIG
jgi:acyl carrier protein